MTDSQETEHPEAMDFSRIQEVSDGDTDFERELFCVFLEDCDERMLRLGDAIASGQSDVIRREAHTIKGAAANVGTTHLQAIAGAIEALDDTNALENAPRLLEALRREYARVAECIHIFLRTH